MYDYLVFPVKRGFFHQNSIERMSRTNIDLRGGVANWIGGAH